MENTKMKISKVYVWFDYGTAKRRTGLNSPAKELHEALSVDYVTEAEKLFKGYTIAFQIEGKVYVADCPHEMIHDHLKTSKNGVLSAFCPLGRQQAIQMVADGKLSYLCSAEELKAVEGNTNGNKVEILLKRAQHTSFDHTKPWYEGGGECRGREVKFFNMDNSSRSQVRLTNAEQMMEVFGYDYTEYREGNEYR
jgi:hypothetical protein